jgi:hypothetical protein
MAQVVLKSAHFPASGVCELFAGGDAKPPAFFFANLSDDSDTSDDSDDSDSAHYMEWREGVERLPSLFHRDTDGPTAYGKLR